MVLVSIARPAADRDSRSTRGSGSCREIRRIAIRTPKA
jgi:hypothetical protein